MAEACSQGQEVPSLLLLPEGVILEVLQAAGEDQRPTLRLVCRLFRDLVDGALSPCFSIHLATHLGGRLGRGTVYPSRLDFTTAAARLLARRAAGLACLEVDFDAYGCVFAAQLLEAQPLPLLASVALQNVEAQHVAALRPLPRLRDVCLSRHINGPVTAGPAAELLVAQLAGLPLQALSLSGYRMLPGVLASIASALPGLQRLVLAVDNLERRGGRLELAGLARLPRLQCWELRLLGGRASAPEVTVAPLPLGATALRCLSHITLAHVRPAPGLEEAFWDSLALLPAVEELRYEADGHAVRQPPAPLLRLATLTSLHIKIEGAIHSGDPPSGTWTQLPELPEWALPRLARLRLECVGLLGLPGSWCRPPLTELHISGLASERSFYCLRLPEELPHLAPSLRRLELPRCGLWVLPDQVAQLTGLTRLDLGRNGVLHLPTLGQLAQLEELELFGSPATNAATALQGCRALRWLGLGTRLYARRRRATLDGSALLADAAYEDAEACRWQDSYLRTVRAALPWVSEVCAGYDAQYV